MTIFIFVILTALFSIVFSSSGERWSVEKAVTWQKVKGYKAGSNFAPSTADNQLEMFQANSYDPNTIGRELGWAKELGFTTMRVFLHDLLWNEGSSIFLKRIDDFLTICDRHGISIVMVLFDSCWNPYPERGIQPDPIPGVHNSQVSSCSIVCELLLIDLCCFIPLSCIFLLLPSTLVVTITRI
jgi:hypothetical protein